MINISNQTIVILPHLDDEFALIPILKEFGNSTNENFKLIYCAERIASKQFYKRRKENLKALSFLGIASSNVTYLNDYFPINGSELYQASKKIYNYLSQLKNEDNFKQIFTLNYEGGHPDHDALALLIDKFSKDYKILTYYFPAYNARRKLFLPLCLFKPLRNQEHFFKSIKYNRFCWLPLFPIAFIYKSEKLAFLKLFPLFIPQVLFSRELLFSESIDLKSVKWKWSFSWIVYRVKQSQIFQEIEAL